MAQIVRKNGEVYVRDDDGQHTAIRFRTQKTEWFWMSNKAFKTACITLVSLVTLAAVGMGAVNARDIPGKGIFAILRGSIQ